MRFAKIYEYARFESLLYVSHIRLLQEEYQLMVHRYKLLFIMKLLKNYEMIMKILFTHDLSRIRKFHC